MCRHCQYSGIFNLTASDVTYPSTGHPYGADYRDRQVCAGAERDRQVWGRERQTGNRIIGQQ